MAQIKLEPNGPLGPGWFELTTLVKCESDIFLFNNLVKKIIIFPQFIPKKSRKCLFVFLVVGFWGIFYHFKDIHT